MLLMCSQGGKPLLPGRWVGVKFGEPWDNPYLTVSDIHFPGHLQNEIRADALKCYKIVMLLCNLIYATPFSIIFQF